MAAEEEVAHSPLHKIIGIVVIIVIMERCVISQRRRSLVRRDTRFTPAHPCLAHTYIYHPHHHFHPSVDWPDVQKKLPFSSRYIKIIIWSIMVNFMYSRQVCASSVLLDNYWVFCLWSILGILGTSGRFRNSGPQCPKLPRISKNCQKLPKIHKIAQNCL